MVSNSSYHEIFLFKTDSYMFAILKFPNKIIMTSGVHILFYEVSFLDQRCISTIYFQLSLGLKA